MCRTGMGDPATTLITQSSMGHTVTKSEGHDSWKRLTLLNVCVFILALGFGMKLAPAFHRQGPPPIERQSVTEWIALTFIIGCAIAGPLTLGAQRIPQGRQSALSMGEWLWMTPSASYSILIPLSRMFPSPLWLLAVLLIHSGNLACSAHVLIIEPLGRLHHPLLPHRTVPCVWTDRFGALLSGSVGAYFWADLLRTPL
jgi:hypothetical protein